MSTPAAPADRHAGSGLRHHTDADADADAAALLRGLGASERLRRSVV